MTPKLKRALQEEGYYNHIIKLLSDPVSPTGIHMNRNFKKYNSGFTISKYALTTNVTDLNTILVQVINKCLNWSKTDGV